MGREIRRVPKGWEHPRDESGHYKPLCDEDYETAAQKWLEGLMAWEAGTHPDRDDAPRYFWEWAGAPPDEEYYRPKWTEPATCYQVYETVSEGTPVSPVFETLDELVAWLVEKGYSPEAARAFAETGWAPSLVVHRDESGVRAWRDIEALGHLND